MRVDKICQITIILCKKVEFPDNTENNLFRFSAQDSDLAHFFEAHQTF